MHKRISILLLGILLLIVTSTAAQQICPLNGQPFEPAGVKDLKAFSQIAVLDQGRVKPMESFARNLLLRFSGRRTFNKKPAVAWVAKFLFSPDSTQNDKIFLINNPEIAMAIGVEPEKKRRYSYTQLQPGYPKLYELAQTAQQIEEKSRSAVEVDVIRVVNNLQYFSSLTYSLSFAFPHPDFTISNPKVKEMLELPMDVQQYSFIDIALRANLINSIPNIFDKKNFNSRSSREKEIIRVVSNLYNWNMVYQNLPLTIIPPIRPDGEKWLSPWDSISGGMTHSSARVELTALRDAMGAYWNGEQIKFNIAMRLFNDSIQKRVLPKFSRSLGLIDLEIFYNHANLFLWVKLLYGVVFLIFLFSLNSAKPIYYRISLGLVMGAFLLHTWALIIRIVIMARPPVTNLYETFIFVGFISTFLGLLIERRNKQWLGIVVTSVSGFIFLTIAGKFSMEGDTLRMLVAVLNSNFWLSTHVLSITTGYAGCCVAGVMGHIYILQSISHRVSKKQLEVTYKTLLGILGFGLTMTFLGTNLGGVWADQSWGRFWGWDPKENGALLIILWTAAIFHAKIARIIGPLGVAIGSVLGIIVVMWAWFGVNLLSVGLHSYGFTSGLARNLCIYLILQLLFLTITIPLSLKKMKR